MKSIEQLEHEYEEYMYMASGLKYDHQQTMKNQLWRKAEDLKEEIRESEQLLKSQYKQRTQNF